MKNIKIKKDLLNEFASIIGDKLEQKNETINLLQQIESLFDIYIKQKALDPTQLNAKDVRLLIELYNVLSTRDKNITSDILEFIDQILKIKDATLTDAQTEKISEFINKTKQINIYVDKGKLTDPVAFTKERGKIFEDLSDDTEDLTGNI